VADDAATCPKFRFTSQGKNSLTMTSAMQNSLHGLLKRVTEKFTKRKKSERARQNRDMLIDMQVEELRELVASRVTHDMMARGEWPGENWRASCEACRREEMR
jgi:DNA topoisomerase VI subunit B